MSFLCLFSRVSRHWLHVFALGLCVLVAGCGNRVDLVGAVPEDQANDILATLLQAGIPANKVSGREGTVGVQVDSSQVGHALELLRANGLPRAAFDGLGQVFRKDGLISSPMEERARYIYALSQELSDTLSQIDGVLVARVHVVLPERGTASDSGVPSTAAVFIKHKVGYNLDLIQPQIRRLVTNSIPDLSADRVSIVFVPAQPLPPGVSAEAPAQVSVLGFQVAPSSATGLGILIWTLMVLLVVCFGTLGWLVWRLWAPKRPAAAPAHA